MLSNVHATAGKDNRALYITAESWDLKIFFITAVCGVYYYCAWLARECNSLSLVYLPARGLRCRGPETSTPYCVSGQAGRAQALKDFFR